jgi:hypothetical protein
MPARFPARPPRPARTRLRRTLIAGAAGAAGLAAVTLVIVPEAQANAGTAPSAPKADVQVPVASASANTVAITSPAVAPDYGYQKVRVGVQVKSGAWVPDGTTTAGTVLQLTETGPNSGVDDSETCNTDADTQVEGSTATYCVFDQENAKAVAARAEAGRTAKGAISPDLTSGPTPSDVPSDELYVLAPGDTLTITQSTVEPNLLTDPATATVGPCTENVSDGYCFVDSGLNDPLETDEIFDDPGLPPLAVDDSGSVINPGTVEVNVLGNDTTHGAPASISIVSGPSHGTAVVVNQISAHAKSASADDPTVPEISYTPTGNFTGVDHLKYELSTANGSSIATVTITVSIPVTANDSAPAGETLHVSAVGTPKHGTASIRGTDIEYTPAAGFTGTDTFPYTDTATFGSASAIVTVTVTPAPASSAPASSPPPSSAAPSSAAPTSSLPSSTSPVANTGVPAEQLTELGALLLAAGVGATVLGRRRRRGRHV